MCAKKAKLTHILAHILAHSQPRYNTHSVPPRTALTCASIGEARKQRHDASHGHGHTLHTLSCFPHFAASHVSLCVQTTPPTCPSTAPSRGCVANACCRSVEASRQQWMRRRGSRGSTRAERLSFQKLCWRRLVFAKR